MTKLKISGLLPAPLYKGRKEEGCGIWLQRVDNGETVFVPSLNKVGDTVPRMTGSAENGYNWRPMYPIEWLQIAAAKDTIETCAAVEECVTNQDDEGKKANKEKLFKFSYGVSSYANGHRGRDDARNSAMFIVDLDGLDTCKPIDIYNQFINGKEKELGIYLVHITPSSRGLRLVAEQHMGETIQQAQVRLLTQLNLENLIDEHNDKSVHDSCRMSYAVGLFHILYINPDGLVFKNKAEADRVAALFEYNNHPQTNNKPMQQNDNTTDQTAIVSATATENKPALADRRKFGEYHNDYKGVPFSQIFDATLRNMGRYPVTEGVRNNTVFRLALCLRYICNNDSTWIQQVLPDYGLPKDEWLGCIKSAFTYPLNDRMPRYFYRALREFGVAPDSGSSDSQTAIAAQNDIIEVEAEEIQVPDQNGKPVKVEPVTYDLNPNALPLPPLTRELELLTARYMGKPQQRYVVPTIVGALAIFYTYLTHIRYYYLRGRNEFALNALTYLIGESRGGKGDVFQGLNIILQPLLDMDEQARKAWKKYAKDMAKYEAACARKKDGEKIPEPEKPQIVERILGAANSVTEVCKMMERAQGQHLLEYSEEIGNFANGLKKDFAATRELYKLAFDNAVYTQRYASGDSWSGSIKVSVNTFFAGTPEFIPILFRSNLSDGFTLRSTITTIEEDEGYEPPLDGYSDETKKELQDICRKFMQQSGFRYCPWIDIAADQFMREKDQLGKKTGSKAAFTLAKTIARIGTCAGYYFSISNGCALTQPGEPTSSEAEKNATAFAQWLMEYEWRQHMTLWGDLLENPVQLPQSGTIPQFLDMLPDEFTNKQLSYLCNCLHKYENNSAVLIKRWLKSKVIEKLDRGLYRKAGSKKLLVNNTLTIAAPETVSETTGTPVVNSTQDTAQTTTTTEMPFAETDVAQPVVVQPETAQPVLTQSDTTDEKSGMTTLQRYVKEDLERLLHPHKNMSLTHIFPR